MPISSVELAKELNRIQPLTNAKARELLYRAQRILSTAITEGRSLPGNTSRENAMQEIVQLQAQVNTSPPEQAVPDRARVERAVFKALDLYDAVAEGKDTLRKARDQLYQDLYDEAAKLANSAANFAGGVVRSAAWGAGTVLGIALVVGLVIAAMHTKGAVKDLAKAVKR